jgi:hypothetical protein
LVDPNATQRRKYIIDTGTRNTSFLQTAKDLKILGVKNHFFFLKLYDPMLKNIDPYSPFLTEEMVMRIINECIINPWYFIREVSRIPDQGGKGVPFKLDRGNLADIWNILNGYSIYTLRPRQTGKTQSALAIILWAFLFGTTHSEMVFNNKEQNDANKNLHRLKEQRDKLPPYMHYKVAFDDDGKKINAMDNVKSLENQNNKNKIVTNAKALSVERAESIGRGCSQVIQHFDEVEFTNHIKTIVQASGPAYKSAAANAKRNNAIYARIFTTTPGDLDTKCCQEAIQIIEGCCTWSESFYDWSKEDVETYIEKNSDNGIIYIEYSYKQLGLGEEWFIETAKTLLNDPMKIKREIFLKRMRGSDMSPFEPEDLEVIAENQGEIKEELFINKYYKLDIYQPLDRSKVCIVSVDCGHGVGEDNTAITALDPHTELPFAEFKSPYIGITDTINFLYVLVRKYLPRAILCIERNHVGMAIIEGLKEKGLINNLYFDNTKLHADVDDKIDESGFLKQQALNRKLYGVYTEKASRELMIDLLFGRVKEFKDKFVCHNIISDILHLVKNKRGKVEAGTGFKDDSIMSYLIGMYVLYYGNNLQRYGFVRGLIPSEEDRNKGLLDDGSDMYEHLPDSFNRDYTNNITEDDLSRKIAKEIYDARQEIDIIDKLTFNSESYKTIDDNSEYDSSIPMSLFDELNN